MAPLSDDALRRQHSPLMSPIIWDLGHIAEFEETWLVRELGGEGTGAQLAEPYDAMRTPRARRGQLALPDRDAVLERLGRVRRAALDLLDRTSLDAADPLHRDGFVYDLVREHEAQHQETILQTITLMTSEAYRPPSRRELPTSRTVQPGGMIRVPGAEFDMGAPDRGFAYDNERPRRRVAVPAFDIGRFPVTNGEYVEFIASGGYADRRVWSEAGWSWKEEAGLFAPKYWEAHAGTSSPTVEEAVRIARELGMGGWRRRTSLGEEPLRPSDPVVNVCFHEAEAYARFRGARLPTETEWEMAAGWDPDSGSTRPYPWGEDPPGSHRANVDQLAFGVSAVGSFPSGKSPVGCEQLLGDVWEWTSTPFRGYPGFRAFPYREYSEVFFGDDYRVLKGASWATLPSLARNTFRNWDYPIRRQIFAGLRLARGARHPAGTP